MGLEGALQTERRPAILCDQLYGAADTTGFDSRPVATHISSPSGFQRGGLDIDPILELLTKRVDRILASVDLGAHGLRSPCYLPGVFADLAEDFDFEAFALRAEREGRMAPGRNDGYGDSVLYQGDGSYHAWFEGDVDRVAERSAGPETWARNATLPLPGWALLLQQILLTRLYRPDSFGWSTEIFYSRQARASIGAHFDNDDVFTVQLHGRKLWEVDPVDRTWLRTLERTGEVSRDGPQSAWHFAADRIPEPRAPLRITLAPGDFLAVPAFALHRVTAADTPPRSVSFNVSICREDHWQRCGAEAQRATG